MSTKQSILNYNHLHLDPEDAVKVLQQKKDEQLQLIKNKFDVLADRTINFAESKDGIFKGLLVVGPAGIGKSITIEQALKKANKSLMQAYLTFHLSRILTYRE